MRHGAVARLFFARPVRAAFDTILRTELVPDLLALPGLRALWIGRHGPDELGDRAIVSLWDSAQAMGSAMGEDIERSRFHPEHLAETTHRRLEVLPVLAEVWAADPPPPTILRIARGRLTHLDLATYTADVDAGARRDLARGRGPGTLLLCEAAPDAFVTISTWADWDAIATATGASFDRPVRTREDHEIDGFSALHLELVRQDR